MALPYFPYFSNCKGFDTFIPIWTILERSKECDLIAPDDTEAVPVFEFGFTPTADSCMGVVLECIYDEIPDDAQPLPR